MARQHLAIVSSSAASALVRGTKRIETRFSRQKRAPYGRISRGDVVYFKLCGGTVVGSAQVSAIEEFTGLTPARVDAVRRAYASRVRAPNAYWAARRRCRYGVLIWLEPLRPVPRGLTFPRQYGGGWVVLHG